MDLQEGVRATWSRIRKMREGKGEKCQGFRALGPQRGFRVVFARVRPRKGVFVGRGSNKRGKNSL
jgi:hypothetical protein